MKNSNILVSVAAATSVVLGGCATSAFVTPVWTLKQSAATPATVDEHLRGYIATYDRMLGDLEVGKALLEVPIIPAAVIGVTGIALGANTDLGIVTGGLSGGLSAGSTYLRPRERLGFVVQARSATVCVLREYVEHVTLVEALGLVAPARTVARPASETVTPGMTEGDRAAVLQWQEYQAQRGDGRLLLVPTAEADTLPLLRQQIAGAGRIAVAAVETISTRLRSRLANIGATPDYGAIVTDLRARFDKARSDAGDSQGLVATIPDSTLLQIAEYSARIQECTAQIQ